MKALLTQVSNSIIVSSVQEIPLRTIENKEVLIKADFSSVNYKDALAVTGKGKILKSLPMIAGIDVAGTITESRSSHLKVGDQVLVTGCGLGETHDGGYSEYVIEHEDNVILRCKNLSAQDAMVFGTAGFTAALCLERMLQNGQTIDMGPILISGASGGVGQFAVFLFSKYGFEVHALSSKRETKDRLLQLGAKKVFEPSELAQASAPLESIRYGGMVDNVGGSTLAHALSQIQLWGNIACVGLAESASLNTTVLPLILRGVSLLGISSNNTPMPLRKKIWNDLTTIADTPQRVTLQSFVNRKIPLSRIVSSAEDILSRKVAGRILVDINA